MNILSLPEEIYNCILLHNTYIEILKLFSVNKKFNDLSRNKIFWLIKSVQDFAISSTNYNMIWSDFNNLSPPIDNVAREVYIKISANKNIYVPRAEYYSNLDRLMAKTITQDKVEYFRYLISCYKTPGRKTVRAALIAAAKTFLYIDILYEMGYDFELTDIFCMGDLAKSPESIKKSITVV